MAGTLAASVVKNDTTSPPAFQNSAGTEIGRLCRAFVNFQGGNSGTTAGTINGSFNVSSVSVVQTGVFQVNYSTAMPDGNYAVAVACQEDSASNLGAGNSPQLKRMVGSTAQTTSVTVLWGAANTAATCYMFTVAVFR